jgi:hypothetical protein
MPIRLSEPPVEAVAALRAGLDAFIPTEHSQKQRKWALEDKTFSFPHRVWTAAPHEISRSTNFRSIDNASWRFLVKGRNGAPLAAEVIQISGGYRWASLNDGSFVASLPPLFEEARQNELLDGKDFEFSLLRVSALYVVAVWLRASAPADDKFIPVAPSPTWLLPGQLYSAEELSPLLYHSVLDLTRLTERL